LKIKNEQDCLTKEGNYDDISSQTTKERKEVSKMTIKTELNKLFDEWENAFPDYEGRFVKDGVINEQLYKTARTKILFVMKEPNDPNQTSWDLAEVFNQSCSGNLSIRLAEWSYGILNDFPPLSSLPDIQALHDALRSTAIINLKKTGGGAQANEEEILKHTERNKSFLQREIKIISPHIIIGCVGDERVWSILFDNINLINSGYDVPVGKWDNIKIINYYHPSYHPVPRAMSYSLLQNIFRCKIFSEL
jgi:hypothetical protein